MRPAATPALLTVLALTGCHQAPQGELTREEAIELAREYAAREMPGTNLAGPPVVRESPSAWIVRFDPPAGFAGGATQVEIDKRTRHVIKAFGEQ
jgi:hypothetical protein